MSLPAKNRSRSSSLRHRRLNVEGLERRELLAITLTPDATPVTGPEASAITLKLGRFSDTDAQASSWRVDIDWGDQTAPSSTTVSAQGVLPDLPHVYADNGSYTITQRITSSLGATAVATRNAAVANASPRVTLAQSAYGATVSNGLTLVATGTDPSATDAAAGLSYTWDFGDGSPKFTGVGASTITRAYQKLGTFTVSVTVADKDGATSVAARSTVTTTMLPIPSKATWESRMVSAGAVVAANLARIRGGASSESLLLETYYDAERVFYQIAEYTKNTAWNQAAQDAERIYRDDYLIHYGGGLPGYWIFSRGLFIDYQRTGDVASKDALISLSRNAAFASDTTPPAWTVDVAQSREVAYNLTAQIDVERLGGPRRARTATLVDQALGHINQWFVSKTAPYVQSFMVGLTCEALINWYEHTGDARVLPAIKTAIDGLWNLSWVASAKSFKYVDHDVPNVGSSAPTADLNLLIAPAFAWVYHQTGDAKYRDRGDLAFSGGAEGAYLALGKQFNQNYKWSFDYIKWRSEAPNVSPTSPKPVLTTPDSGSVTALENTSVSLNLGSFSDGSAATAWTLTVSWGDGTAPANLTLTSPGALPTLSHAFPDNGVYTVTRTIVSSLGSSASASQVVTITNAAPSVALATGPYSATTSDPIAFAATGADRSPTDVAAGLTYTWNFGDGSPSVTGLRLAAPSHVYRTPGTFTLSVTATDKDGGVSSAASTSVTVAMKAIADLATWESRMTSLGVQYANQIQANSLTSLFGFDMGQAFYQIADYTKNATFLSTAAFAAKYYRIAIVQPYSGRVPETLNFGRGLTTDFQKTRNNLSKTALGLLVNNATASLTNPSNADNSEGVAQAILTLLAANDLGIGNAAQLNAMVNHALGHLSQWFVTKTAATIDPRLVGYTMEALIKWAEFSGDVRVQPLIQTALDSLFTQSWNAAEHGFRVQGSADPANANANLMIAPAYAWLYRQTGDVNQRNRGDLVFSEGVKFSSAATSAQVFADDYNWSFDFVKWRKAAPKV